MNQTTQFSAGNDVLEATRETSLAKVYCEGYVRHCRTIFKGMYRLSWHVRVIL